MDSINPGEDPKPNYGLDLRPDELATHGFTQAQETFLGYITGTGYHTCPIYEVNEGVVKLISPGFTQTKETFRDFACSYPSPSYGLNVELGISMRKATLKDFGDYSSVPNHKLDVSLVKPTSPGFAQTQETSLGNTAGYYLSPSYGLDLDLVKPTQKVIFDHLGDYPTLPSHELDVGPVKPVNDAFAWIQKVIFKNIRDYPSIPRYELNVGLVKPVTNAFAWIERGIDAIDNIVSLIHRYVARSAPGFLAKWEIIPISAPSRKIIVLMIP